MFRYVLALLLTLLCIDDASAKSDISIRVLILKHAVQEMANGDARLVVQAVRVGSSNGLDVKYIGQFFIDRDGKIDVYYGNLKQFIKTQSTVDAQSGDTLIIFTVGHGHQSGGLATLGARQQIMRMLAEIAQETSQKTIWWQLSCHATARLPSINSLTPQQQELFSIVASSSDYEISPAYVEGDIMKQLFLSIARNSQSIDPNQDGVIEAQEMSMFLDRIDQGRGSLVFAKSPTHPIFGSDLISKIPVINLVDYRMVFPPKFLPKP